MSYGRRTHISFSVHLARNPSAQISEACALFQASVPQSQRKDWDFVFTLSYLVLSEPAWTPLQDPGSHLDSTEDSDSTLH